jgi:hypothetical protein
MRRNWGRCSRTASRWSLDCQLDVETLENRLALSHSMAAAYEADDAQYATSEASNSYAPAPPAARDSAPMSLGSFGPGIGDPSSDQSLGSRTDFAPPGDRHSIDINHGYATLAPPAQMAPTFAPASIEIVVVIETSFAAPNVSLMPFASPHANQVPRTKLDMPANSYDAYSTGNDNVEVASASYVTSLRPQGVSPASAPANVPRGPQGGDINLAAGLSSQASAVAAGGTTPLLPIERAGARAPSEGSQPFTPSTIPHVDSHSTLVERGAADESVVLDLPFDRAAAVRGAVPTLDASAPSGAAQASVEEALHTRPALAAGVSLRIEAVDEALQAAMSEVESLGGELAGWIEEVSMPPWAIATIGAAAVGFGARRHLKRRRSSALRTTCDEESSSWLFTRLHQVPGP